MLNRELSDFQKKILDLLEQNKILSLKQMGILLHKNNSCIYDSIYKNRINLENFVDKISIKNGKKGRPETYFKYKVVIYG